MQIDGSALFPGDPYAIILAGDDGAVGQYALSVTCECADGYETDDTGACAPLMCETRIPSGVQEHGSVSGSRTYGQGSITLTCDPGYVVEGADTTTCQSDGTYSNELGTCSVDNPCVAGTDNCDANAACDQDTVHQGPGTHTCTCTNDGDHAGDYFGDGRSPLIALPYIANMQCL